MQKPKVFPHNLLYLILCSLIIYQNYFKIHCYECGLLVEVCLTIDYIRHEAGHSSSHSFSIRISRSCETNLRPAMGTRAQSTTGLDALELDGAVRKQC